MNQGEGNTDKTKKITGISVCICTYRRPTKLKYLLEHLVDQISDLEIKAEIIIVDNDYQQSAKDVVEKIGNKILYKYLCEPIKNISLARNKAVRTAQYDFIALIDDDEYPSSDWLKNFISFYKLYPCHGVLGPVRPIFETEPPAWISESSLFQRPEFKSGTRLKPEHMRTGNAFIMKELFYLDDNPFDPNLGLTGGEDVDFFRRMFRRGYKFITCICAWLQCSWRPSLPSKNANIKPMLKYAVNTFGNFSINYFARNIDKTILGWKLGSIELGGYDRAYRLFVLPVNQLVDPISSVALSTLSKVQDDPKTYQSYYLKSLSLISFLGMYLSAIITITGKEIIYILLGPKWDEAGLILQAFGPAVGIILIYQTISWIFLSRGKPDLLLKWTFISTLIMTAIYFLGIKYGAPGLALSYGHSLYLLTIPGLFLASRLSGIKLRDIWKNLWKHLFTFLFSSLISFLLAKSFDQPTILLRFILKLMLVTFTYFPVAIFILNEKAQIKYLIDIANVFFKKKRQDT